jgi:hypothetical protein
MWSECIVHGDLYAIRSGSSMKPLFTSTLEIGLDLSLLCAVHPETTRWRCAKDVMALSLLDSAGYIAATHLLRI